MITLASEEDVPQSLSLLQSALGSYVREEVIRRLMDGKDSAVLVYKRGALVEGVITLSLLNHQSLKQELPSNRQDLLNHLKAQNYGLLRSIVVLPEARGGQVGRALAQEALNWLEGRGAERILVIAWGYELFSERDNLWLRQGFSLLGKIENFWYQESLESSEDYCPRCGRPCSCSALIYHKVIPRVSAEVL